MKSCAALQAEANRKNLPGFDECHSTVYYQLHIRCSGSRCESGAAPQLYRGTTVHYATVRAGRRAGVRTPSQETGRIILRTAFRGEGWLRGRLAPAPIFRTRRKGFSLLLPAAAPWTCPRHEGGYASQASIVFGFILARFPAYRRDSLPLRLTHPSDGSRDDFL
jgi:hypothetical protein